MKRPPERIEVTDAGVVLRRHRDRDIDALHAVIEGSRDHLRPFMAWADQDRQATAAFVGRVQEGWASDDSYSFLVVNGDDTVLGGCGLHRRAGPDTIEIGYWLRPDAVGRGVMTAAAGRLADIALTLDGIDRVEIRCDEANIASAAVPSRLGFVHVDTCDKQTEAPGETGRHQIWVRHRVGAEPPAHGA